MVARAPAVQREPKKPGAVGRVIGALAKLISTLVLALVCSILLAWLGMTVWWPKERDLHSEQVLAQELRYLSEDFDGGDWVRPATFARTLTHFVREGSESLGLTGFIASRHSDPWIRVLQGYAQAMLNVVQIFAVRIAVLALAIPLFSLFGVAGMAEGLMRRDLRRWGGGRESSFVYHHSKRLLGPSMCAASVLYLASPFSIHPSCAVLPLAMLFALGVVLTIATFKKYL
jgi:integrating conjugative element membrane protein (TIGR03747 family)